jgi:hypothetical protein
MGRSAAAWSEAPGVGEGGSDRRSSRRALERDIGSLDLPTFAVFGSVVEKRGKGLQQREEERQSGPTPNPGRRRSSHGGLPQEKQQTLGPSVGLRGAPRPGS